MKKICFIAQFPPPMHGLSKAVDTLYNSELSNKFEFEKVDIKDNKQFLNTLKKIALSKADLFYFTISQSKGGNLRDLIIMKLLKIQHKRCLIHLHGGYYRQLVDNDLRGWQQKANYNALANLDGAIVLGNSLKKIFHRMLPDEKIFVVPNCVDDEYLMSDFEFEKKVSTFDSRPIKHVLYLSNFIRSKGYPEVLEMAKQEKERCSLGEDRIFHFDFAGKFFKKEDENFFFDYIKEHDLYNYVTYHGIVEGNKKRELLKQCDVFVLLTRYPNEGQPISILEAMGNGMIIVTTDHAGIPDIVSEKSGLVFSSEKKNTEIYEKLCDLIRHFNAIVSYNRQMIKDEYNEKLYLESVSNIWNSILED